MIKTIIIAILSLTIGLFIGRNLSSNDTPDLTNTTIIKSPTKRQKIVFTTESKPEKVQCNEELVRSYYQKAILLFLASINNKISPSEKRKLEKLAAHPEDYQDKDQEWKDKATDLLSNIINM